MKTAQVKIESIEAVDIRFPTSRTGAGSDAINTDPDYSAAYCIVHTNHPELKGYGLTFTNGRGNDLCVAAIEELGKLVTGMTMDQIMKDMAGFWRRVTGDTQLRWLGPQKGILHMSAGALINAIWDLLARMNEKPLWLLISEMTPEELVRCIDFTDLQDVLTESEALAILKKQESSRSIRVDALIKRGYPAYTTSIGWLGYSDDQIRSLTHDALAKGWSAFKIKVGKDTELNKRRSELIRDVIGPENKLMMDANQCWEREEAVKQIKALAPYDPWWIEEPIHPDDILGYQYVRQKVTPVRIAMGEHCHNRVMFKQFIQSHAIDVCQIDSCRVAGVNEVISIMLMAAKYDIPVCPHAGGVGLCEYVQHLSMIDYVCISGTMQNRVIEYVDHLHNHFVDPVVIRNARYMPPSKPGYSVKIKEQSKKDYTFPTGKIWN